MATLPYIQLYVADYLADTMHLTTEEHGAYLLIIFNYWQTGKPIPKNRLAGIARMSNERWTDVEHTLSEFFEVVEQGCWKHARIEEDLARVREKSTKAAKAGKASAAKRASAKSIENKEVSNERSTPEEQTMNHIKKKDKDNRNKIKDTSPVPEERLPPNHEMVIDIYHDTLKTLPKVVKKLWKGKRKKHLTQILREEKHQSPEFWKWYFEAVKTKPFWMGESDKAWNATLEWLVNPENFIKVCEHGANRRAA